jgi:hypothetical protein
MAGRLRSKIVSLGASVGALAAAATMATTAAPPAKADLDDLIEPIVQPIIASLSDSIALFDPAAALDLTNWADTFLDSLNATFDFALPPTDSALAAAAVGTEPAVAAATGTTSIPLEVLIGTEPVVNASLNGGESVPLLLDTGSAGLVVPLSQFGDNYLEQLESLFSFGFPAGFASSGYSGGVDYFYLTYNSVPVDYLNGDGTIALATDGPVNIEVYSFNPGDIGSLFTNDAFERFLDNNQVDGILGVGYNAYGPTVSPFINYDGVLVDIPNGQFVVYDNGDFVPPSDWVSTSGAPISNVFEQVNDGTKIAVTANFDSGGVFGTIPSSLAPGGSVPDGTLISVYNADNELLYSYTVGPFDVTDDGTPDLLSSPTVVSGTYINSGTIPFLNHSVYLDYSGDYGTTYFSPYIP